MWPVPTCTTWIAVVIGTKLVVRQLDQYRFYTTDDTGKVTAQVLYIGYVQTSTRHTHQPEASFQSYYLIAKFMVLYRMCGMAIPFGLSSFDWEKYQSKYP